MPRVFVKVLLLTLPTCVVSFLLWELYSNDEIMSSSEFQFKNWLFFLLANLSILFLLSLYFVIAWSVISAKQKKKIFEQENNIEFLNAEIQVLKVDKQYLEEEKLHKDQLILDRDLTLSYHCDLLSWANREVINSKSLQDFIQRIRSTTKFENVGLWEFNNKTANLEPLAYYDHSFKHFVEGQVISLEDNPKLYHWFENGKYLIYNSKTAHSHRSDFGDTFFDSLVRHSFIAMPMQVDHQFVGLLLMSHENFDYQYDSSMLLQAKFFSQIAVMLISKMEVKDLFAHQRGERNAVLNLLDLTDNATAKFNFRKPLLIGDNIEIQSSILLQARIWHSNPAFDQLFAIKNKETYFPDELVLNGEILNYLIANNFQPFSDSLRLNDRTFRRKIIADLSAGLFTGIWVHLTEVSEIQKLSTENQDFRSQIKSYSEWQKNAQSEILSLSNQLKIAHQATLGEMTFAISQDGTVETAQGFDSLIIGRSFVSLFESDVNLRKLLKEVENSKKPAVVKVNYRSEDKLLIVRNVFGRFQASLLPLPVNSSDFYSKAVFEYLPVGVCIIDRRNQLVYYNQLANNFLELNSERFNTILEVIKNKLLQNRAYDNLVKIGSKTLRIKASRSKDSYFVIIEPSGDDKDWAARFYYSLIQKLPIPLAVFQLNSGLIRYSNPAFHVKWPHIKQIQVPQSHNTTSVVMQNGTPESMQLILTEQGWLAFPENQISDLAFCWASLKYHLVRDSDPALIDAIQLIERALSVSKS